MSADLPRQSIGKPLNFLQKFGWQVVFGKIDNGLEPGQRPYQSLPPALIQLTKRPFHLAQRLAPLLFRVGIDQIGDALSRCQIQLTVLERPPRELARFCRPQTWNPGEFIDHGRKDGATAMEVQFRHILAGEAGRSRECGYEAVIQNNLVILCT